MFLPWLYSIARSLYSFFYQLFFSVKEVKEVLKEPPKYEDKYKKEVALLQREVWTEEEKRATLQKLAHCYVVENTPYGNVLMTYNDKRETFEYYSDHVIPYRYLEVVGRKFVKQFQCAFLFVDMEEELAKLKEKRSDKVEKEKVEKEKTQQEKKEKRSVFAKFKKYQSNDKRAQVVENTEFIKERTNYYSHQGKLTNFQWIQKINKKEVNKKLTLSYADFKKSVKL